MSTPLVAFITSIVVIIAGGLIAAIGTYGATLIGVTLLLAGLVVMVVVGFLWFSVY